MNPSEPWAIVEVFDPGRAKGYEGLFTQGFEGLHVRGSLEEHPAACAQNAEYVRRAGNVTSERFASGPKWGAYVPGLFAPHPTLGREMVNLPFFLGLDLECGGERIHSASARVRRHEREWRLDTGVLRRRLEFEGASGERVAAVFERFVDASGSTRAAVGGRGGVCVQRLTLTSDRAASVRVRSTIDADVRTNGHDHFQKVSFESGSIAGPGATVRCLVSTDGEDVVEVVSWAAGDWEGVEARAEARRTHLVGRVSLRPGVARVIEKRTLVRWGQEAGGGRTGAWAGAAAVLASGDFASRLAAHGAAWEARWARCGVDVEARAGGGGRSSLALRAAVHHLIRAHPGEGGAAIDAKGFAGEAYWGRYFWDTEMFLLPFHLYTDPARARSLVDFRVRSLDGARANAARYGYRGAKYAWESDERGNECCPNWQYADHEIHVTADVAYAIAHLAAAAPEALGGEGRLLRGPAAGAVVEAARFFMDRMDTRAGDSHASLLGVMGPDEYHPITHNNAYTNVLASFTLKLASQVGAWSDGSGERHALSEGERAEFGWAAGRLGLVRSQSDPLLVLQSEGFDRLADPAFDRRWKDRARTFAANVSQERLYRSRALKQADVLMMMWVFPEMFTDEEVRRAWEYYEPLTTHDSSLSPAVHGMVACRLGLEDRAWEFWERGSGLDLPGEDGSAPGASEGIHVANAGGTWMMAVMGFAGLRSAMRAEWPVLTPRLPEAWGSIEFPLAWRGARLRVRLSRAKERLEGEVRHEGWEGVPNGAGGPVRVTIAGRALDVGEGEGVSFAAKTPAEGPGT